MWGKIPLRMWGKIRYEHWPPKICSGEKLYECSECRKHLNRNSTLWTQKRFHSTERTQCPCMKWKKSFSQLSCLVGHRNLHTRERCQKCSECDKCLSHKRNPKKNKRKNAGKKLFECSECEKSLISRSHVRWPQWVHTGEKPQKSFKCGKSFISSSDLINTGGKTNKYCG